MLIGHASGLLLHPTSLPNAFGIGDLGSGAYEFLDWLALARQRVWQVLPLGPTDHGDSPYQSPSAFAGNPALISFEALAADGLLDAAEVQAARRQGSSSASRVDFDHVRQRKMPWLATAAQRVVASHGHLQAEFETFCRNQAEWLDGYARFMSLREANFGRVWCEWTNLVDANFLPLADSPESEASAALYRAVQFLFFRQWNRLRAAAHQRGILLIGDVPIYVSFDSADVWSHRQFFQLNEHGRSTFVAGVPPDYFSATGQLWNNPLYDWDALKRDNYHWWIRRMKSTLSHVDLVRLDHFRGFEAYWSVPAGERTAENGHWIPGPAGDFLQSLEQGLTSTTVGTAMIDGLPIIAEDLGMITAPVHALRQQFGLPGMKVLQFILPGEPDNVPDLQAFEPNSVVYTGTHDNDTTLGWFRSEIMPRPDRWERLRRWTPCQEETISREFISLAWRSASHLAVAPVQDVLSLGTEARMNTPGTSGQDFVNWQWRLQAGQLTEQVALDLADLTVATGRAM